MTTHALVLAALMSGFLGPAWADEIAQIEARAQGGDSDAQLRLGLMYDTGYGLREDRTLAGRWISLAALSGASVSKCLNTFRSEEDWEDWEGSCVPVVRQWLAKEFKNFPPAAYYLSNSRWGYCRRDSRESWALIEAAAKSKVVAAQREMCENRASEFVWYDNKKPKIIKGSEILFETRQNVVKQSDYEWCIRAAENGDNKSQYNLARLYGGAGEKRDRSRALYWYRKAAEEGNLDASLHLTWTYLLKDRYAKNRSQGEQWANRACDLAVTCPHVRPEFRAVEHCDRTF